MLNRKSRIRRKRKTSKKQKQRLVDFLEEVADVLEDASLPNYTQQNRNPTNLKG